MFRSSWIDRWLLVLCVFTLAGLGWVVAGCTSTGGAGGAADQEAEADDDAGDGAGDATADGGPSEEGAGDDGTLPGFAGGEGEGEGEGESESADSGASTEDADSGGGTSDGGEDPSAPPTEEGDDGVEDGDEEPDEAPDDNGIEPGTLTAGSFDDNLNLPVFEEFVDGLLQNDAAGDIPDVSLEERVIVTVTTEGGDPVGNARVVVAAADTEQQAQPLIDQPTRSDGRVFFSTGLDGAGEATAFNVTVYPPDGSDPVTASADLAELDWTVTLPGVEADLPTQLDLAFVVDATGSMADELEYLKVEMDNIASTIAEQHPNVDQRYALIVYRDEGDDYVTRDFDFTESLEGFQANLSDQEAQGGGDYPEAMHLALEDAQGLTWRAEGTARVLFLVADAPPHAEFAQRTLDAVMALRSAGVVIYPVAASGVAEEAELVMRTAALVTLAEYIFLTDDSGVGSSHAEPHIPCYMVEALERVMIRMISAELDGVKTYPDEQDVIRVVGNPVDGVCVE